MVYLYFTRGLIIVNMYIAVIFENYCQAMDDILEGITDEDYEIFYEIWAEFDPEVSGYIHYGSLSELVDLLDPPLQVAKPNKFSLVGMDIPLGTYTHPTTGVVTQDMVHHQDVIQACTEQFFLRCDYDHSEDSKVLTRCTLCPSLA